MTRREWFGELISPSMGPRGGAGGCEGPCWNCMGAFAVVGREFAGGEAGGGSLEDLRVKNAVKDGLERCLEGLPFAFWDRSVLVLRLSGAGRFAARSGCGEVIGVWDNELPKE